MPDLRRIARRTFVSAAPALRRTGLTLPAWRTYERFRAGHDAHRDPTEVADGLAIPPAALRVRVISSRDPAAFLDYGSRTAALIADSAARHGMQVTEAGRLLDFGCGCGRVTRHWHRTPGVEVHGADHDEMLVDWTREHLPFVQAHHNQLNPPLPYEDESFGLVYAISVFTHLTEEVGAAWMSELRRILRPGGILMFTVHGESLRDRLLPQERIAFDRGDFVVQFGDAEGSNLCTAFHPEPYVHSLTREFDRLELQAPSVNRVLPQDLWIVRRPMD